MRIGFLTYGMDRPQGGISRYTQELISAYARQSPPPDITLFSAGTAGSVAKLGFPMVQLPGCRLLPGLLVLGNGLLPGYAQHYGIDVFHDPTGVTPIAFGVGRAQAISTIHDVIPWSFPGVSTRLDNWIYRTWLPRVLPHIHRVITMSDHSRSEIIRYLQIDERMVHVIPNGVSPEMSPVTLTVSIRQRYQLPESYILYLGSVEERKNLRRVLQVYALLKQRGVTQGLVLAGPLLRKYTAILQMLQDLGLEQNVRITGFVAEEDLPALYSGADLFVFPSLYEGFGLPVLEAMACGTPVVTSCVSSLPEVGGDAAIYVDPLNVEGMAAEIQSLLNDSARRATLRDKGLQRAQQFSWERVAQETLKVYETVHRQRRAIPC